MDGKLKRSKMVELKNSLRFSMKVKNKTSNWIMTKMLMIKFKPVENNNRNKSESLFISTLNTTRKSPQIQLTEK